MTVSAIASSVPEPAPAAPAGSSLAPLRSPIGVALIAGTVLASGVASYDAYVVNVAVPAIGGRFDAGVAAMYSADKLDPDKIAEQQKKVDELRRQMIKSHAETHNQVMAVLTPEQRKQARQLRPGWATEEH